MKLLLIIVLALALRLLLAVTAPINPDATNYATVAAIVRGGGNVYEQTQFYNYSPLWFHILGVLDMARGAVPLAVAVRVFLSALDMPNIILIHLIAKHLHPERAIYGAILYAFNPATVLIVAWHGQFESLALLPALAAVLLGLRYVRAGRQT